MLRHLDIWLGLDRLARRHGLTPSGLARRAGLDATAFNPSKRHGGDGRERWPSTESLAKVLAATATTLSDFGRLLEANDDGAQAATAVPVITLPNCIASAFDDDGFPAGPDWGTLAAASLPPRADPRSFALRVEGAALEPVFADGALLLASPAATLRRGDRSLVVPRIGPARLGLLDALTARQLTLLSLGQDNAGGVAALALTDVKVTARLMWASL